MCGYLHYADNTHRKIRAMFLVHNAMFKMYFFLPRVNIFSNGVILPKRKQTWCCWSADRSWSGLRDALVKLARYTRKMHFKHFVMNEKHSKYFAVCIICIMQVCTHFSSNYLCFRAKRKNNNIFYTMSCLYEK